VIRVGEQGDYTAQCLRTTSVHSLLNLGGLFPGISVEVPVMGAFNRANAVMALTVTHLITGTIISDPLQRWRGIRRRQDVLFERKGLLVFADYAHHPTEIAALLEWVRETHPGKLIVVFQPHRHTRTRQYAAEFRQALLVADHALVLPVYAAGEPALEGGHAQSVVADSKLKLIENRNDLPAQLKALVDGEDTVVAFVGAGDIERDAENYALLLRREGLPALTKDLGEWVAGKISVTTILKANEPLAKHTTLGVGGVARWYAEPASAADIKTLLEAAGELGLPYFVIGRGSNLWVPDEGYDGLIIHLASETWGSIKLESDNYVRVGAGVRLKELCGIAAREGLQGFEFLEGIPGTIGGSLRMNAGAMDSWIFDLIESIEWITPMGVVRTAKRNCFDALYRDCPQLHGAVILSAVLKARGKANPETIRQTMETYSLQRRQSQPRDPSAGCVFRNPETSHAGRLIDQSGLKGVQVGAAMVSPVHANFIINKGDAKAVDVLGLMREVRRQVQQKHGHVLQPEIIALGREWKDLL
jgi:UDP-N-acetylenolpyruvoylglucosamine reductase